MRNLKRALSLALASVMLLGMMVVGTSAASYTDVDENDNVEAIEVLNAVNVMIGRQGNFEPDEAVNRHEMAVIMAKLVLGVDIADNYVGTHPYTDVVPWADKYVAACYENGLVYGKSATTYNGNDPLTAVEAAAMMLRALGYKDLNKGYQGDWRAPITAMANQIRLFSGVASNPSEKLDRNQVAQLALNTLKSPIVNLKDNTISWSNDEGQIIMTGGSREYIVLSSREAYARAINDVESQGTSASAIGGWTVELGEHLYNGKLQLRDATDVFGRPARHWEYDGKVIGDYAKEELLVKKYNDDEGQSKVTGKDLYDLLSSDVLDDYDLNVYVDGVNDPKIVDRVVKDGNRNTSIVFDRVDLNRNNKAAVGATGTGVQTEVYVDHLKHEINVAIINTYLAIADKDYDTKKEETPLTIYGVKQETVSNEYVKLKDEDEPYKLGVEEFAIAADMAKNDSFLVTLADQEIQSVTPAEVVSGATLSAFKLDDHVVSGGTEYTYTTNATYKSGDLNRYTGDGKENLKDRTYDIYLDAYGNLIGLKEIAGKTNYVFISGLDRNGSNLVNRIATANAVFLDGTSDTIQINMTKSTWNDDVYTNQNTEGEALLNTWCTYTKSGDIYTVKEVYSAGSSSNLTGAKAVTSQFHQTGTTTGREADKEFEINLKNLRLDGGGANSSSFRYVYGDSDSVYLTAELDELRYTQTTHGVGNYGIITGAETVSTGIIDTSITVWDIKGAADAAETDKVTGTIPDNNANKVAHGVYTLYNDKGTIIAAMAVGEGSAAKDLVYVHSDGLDLESDNGNGSRAAGDGLWTWTRRVIRDGQEVTLSEVGDASEELEYMLQYHWYEVREDGNGDVIKVTEAADALGSTGRDRFVTDYTKINETVEWDNVSTVLFQSNGGPRTSKDFTNGYYTDLLVKGNNTLAVNTLDGSGIHFRNDVNVVLQYWNRNTKEIDIMAGEGVDDLKDMVSIVNDNNDFSDRRSSTYYLSALIENGLATDIVIFDSYNTYSPDRPVTPTGDARLVWNDKDKDDQYWNLIIPAAEYHKNMTTAEIANWLRQAGCSDISKTRLGWNFTRNGMDYTDQAIVVIPTESYTVTVKYGANGTASADVERAEIGDKVTVTAVPANGYEVSTVNAVDANGNSVSVSGTGNTRTFTMGSANVTVTVTFKETTVVSEKYTVTFGTNDFNAKLTSTNSEVFADGTLISDGAQVEKDAVITVNPVAALDVTRNDAAKTITVAPKDGFTWSKTFGMWMGTKDNGDMVTVPFDATAVAASMFRLARAVADDASKWPEGPVDTTIDGWFGLVSRDYGATYTISVGSSVVWTGKITKGATAWKLTSGSPAEAKAAIGNIDSAVVEKTDMAAETPELDVEAMRDLPVQIAMTGNTISRIDAYFGANATADKERQIEAADIAKALTAYGLETKAGDVKIAEGKATTVYGSVITWATTGAGTVLPTSGKLASTGSPAQRLWMVTYPDGVIYLRDDSASPAPTAAERTVKLSNKETMALIPSDPGFLNNTDMATEGVVIAHADRGEAVLVAPTENTTWVRAYKFDAQAAATGVGVGNTINATNGTIELTKATSATPPVNTKAQYEMYIKGPGCNEVASFKPAVAAGQYVAEGAEISFVVDSTYATVKLLAGQKINVKVNGEVKATATVTEDDKVPALGSIKIEGAADPTGAADVGENVAIVFELTDYNPASDVKVYLNDKEVTEKDADGKYILRGVDRGMTIVKAVNGTELDTPAGALTYAAGAGDNDTEIQHINQTAKYDLDAAALTPGTGDIYAKPSTDKSGDEVRLYTAWTFIAPTPGWTVSKSTVTTGGFTELGTALDADTYYFKTEAGAKDRTIFVQAASNGQQLWYKKGGTGDGDASMLAPKVYAGKNLKADQKGIWELTIDRNIADTELVVAYTITDAASTAKTAGVTGLKVGTPEDLTLAGGCGTPTGAVLYVSNKGGAEVKEITRKDAKGNEYAIRVNEDGDLEIESLTKDIDNSDSDYQVTWTDIEVTLAGGYKVAVAVSNNNT